MASLRLGDSGDAVTALQQALASRGFDPGGVDGLFGRSTLDALIAFQGSSALRPDGVAGPRTAAALGIELPPNAISRIPGVTAEMAGRMLPGAPRLNIEEHLPLVLNALIEPALADRSMILMALSSIRAETSGFAPVSEGKSQFNTSGAGHDFDLYDNRADLGNQGPPDGALFRGRGFIQLTGRANYAEHGAAIGLGNQLVEEPELANNPAIAARLLASFLKAHEAAIRAALGRGDLAQARKLVNGGKHGLAEFSEAYRTGDGILPAAISVTQASAA